MKVFESLKNPDVAKYQGVKNSRVDLDDRKNGNNKPTDGSSRDVVELSDDFILMEEMKMKIREVDEVREDLIISLRAKIDSGSYRISSEDLADHILDSMG